MKPHHVVSFISACVLITLGISGCVTDDNSSTGSSTTGVTGNIKSMGVYTTITITDIGLEMPVTGYLQKNSFGPGEMPGAVVLGYGTYDHQQEVTLELIELDTGHSLLSTDHWASYGKAWMLPLHIRLSGNYELRLTSGDTRLDTWQFTVTRTNSSGIVSVDTGNVGKSYADGNFWMSLSHRKLPELFDTYDENLNYYMVNAIGSDANSFTNKDLFAQRFPGKVVIQCRLDFQGHLTDPKILENTMDDDCGKVFIKALLDRSPYDPWPQDVHQKFGSDERELTVEIYFR